MFNVTYEFRRQIERHKQWACEKTLVAESYFRQGGLYYFKLDKFNYQTVPVERTIEIKEAE